MKMTTKKHTVPLTESQEVDLEERALFCIMENFVNEEIMFQCK